MKIVTKEEMKKYPGETVFANYYPHTGIELSNVEVKDSPEFGAKTIIPQTYEDCDEPEIFDYDWSIDDYTDNDRFIIFTEKEVLLMIRALSGGD